MNIKAKKAPKNAEAANDKFLIFVSRNISEKTRKPTMKIKLKIIGNKTNINVFLTILLFFI